MNSTKMKIKFCNLEDTFTVRQLIEELQKCENQDAPVTVWLMEPEEEGYEYTFDATGRYPINSVDDTFDNHRMVDINVMGYPVPKNDTSRIS